MLAAALLCLVLTGYAFAGYAGLMALLARLRPRPWQAVPEAKTNGISIVLCVHNAADRIQERLQNLLACDWSGDLQLVVYCDGGHDDSAARARAFASGGAEILVIESTENQGKASGLNQAIPHCRHAIVVLCDVRQTFARDALTHLVAPFADPHVGAVSGQLDIAASASGGGRGVDLYWRLETRLRFWESCFDSVIGCTGAICALRRDLFTPLPADTLLDDVVIPMRLAVAGHRVIYEPRARAFDPQTLRPELEQTRKRRTLVGNFQMLERHPGWLLPWRNRLWWQLFSHKYLRLLAPWLLIAVAVLSLLAPATLLSRLLLGGQAAAYALALLGWFFPHVKSRLLTIPAGFALLQASCIAAFFAYLKHRRNYLALWQPGHAALSTPTSAP